MDLGEHMKLNYSALSWGNNTVPSNWKARGNMCNVKIEIFLTPVKIQINTPPAPSLQETAHF